MFEMKFVFWCIVKKWKQSKNQILVYRADSITDSATGGVL